MDAFLHAVRNTLASDDNEGEESGGEEESESEGLLDDLNVDGAAIPETLPVHGSAARNITTHHVIVNGRAVVSEQSRMNERYV